MPKVATDTVSVFSSDRDFWKQDDSYGFTHAGKDYGVGVAGECQDRVGLISTLLFRRLGAVLGKTEAEMAAAVSDVATIETWYASPTETTDVPVGAAIVNGSLYVKDQNDDYVEVTITTTAGIPVMTLGSPAALPSES